MSTSIELHKASVAIIQRTWACYSPISVQWWSTNRDILRDVLVIVVVECVHHL